MSKEKWFLLVVISILSGIVIAFMYINPYEEMTLSGIICQISGSSGPFQLGYSFTELTGFALRMIPTYVFEGCFGIYLYHRFCTASVYIFSRYTKRVRWYLKESFFLGVYAASFQSVLVGAAVVTTVLRYGEKIRLSGWTMMGYHCLMDTLWIWAISILINLIALFLGSGLAFMIGIGTQMVFTAALFVGNYAGNGKWIQWLLKINPAAHLVMGWHKKFVPDNGDDIGIYFPALDLNYSLLIFLIFLLIIIGIGAFVIKRFDIMASDMEMGVF